MTMGEFELRAYAYRREQQWDWAKFRMIAYWAVRAFNIAPKTIPKKPSDIIELDFVDKTSSNVGISKEAINAFKEAEKVYLAQRNKQQNGNK